MSRYTASFCPAASLPGMVIVSFHAPLPDITTPGGNPGKISQTGCAEGELDAFLASLEAQHGIEIVLTNPITGPVAVQLVAGPR